MTKESNPVKDIAKLRQEFELMKKDIEEGFLKNFVATKNDTYHYIAREIKNECNIETLIDYLFDKGVIGQEEFLKHKGDSKLFQSFKDENNNIHKIAEYFENLQINFNVESQKNPSEFVSMLNLLAQRERFLYKKEKMIKRGFSEDSEHIKHLNKAIKEFSELILKQKKLDKKKIKKEEYFLKKDEAEKIYETFSNKKDEIVDRIRELPILNDKIHLEIENKSLYYEAVSNFWFGNFNASICMLSIFIESFLKEMWYYKKKEHYENDLENLLSDCLKEEIIIEKEKNYLLEIKNHIRNNYIHSNLHKILPEIVVPAYMVSLKGEHKPKPTYMTSDKFPVLRSIVKMDTDKKRAKQLIIEVVKVVETITTRNYDFQYKETK
ncbi:hypothetical protein KAT36_00365 [Candidatus Pacearchaeota archaeon]|nr:hypothetical protein [Candidatus Pacearchaeota archaeon]